MYFTRKYALELKYNFVCDDFIDAQLVDEINVHKNLKYLHFIELFLKIQVTQQKYQSS